MSDDDDEAIENVEHLKAFSATIRDDCRKYGLAYFEKSDHLSTIDEAIRYLSQRLAAIDTAHISI